MAYLNASIFLLFTIVTSCASDGRRPIYNIAHMVNSIGQIRKYLDLGANVIEADIQFYTNGLVMEAYHGFPCDCFRHCTHRASLRRYLQYVRYITDPSVPGNYAEKMVMQFFDLKLNGISDKKESGRDLARHVLDFLWSKGNSRKQEIRVLVYINSVRDVDAIEGFIEEFQIRGQLPRLKDVGFDGGSGDIWDTIRMFVRLGISWNNPNGKSVSVNTWIGDGKTNCLSAIYPDGRLRRELAIRNARYSFIQKVYHWTIDLKFRMRMSLDLGVDGMITNDPDDLAEVLEEPYYRRYYRLATPEDDPFERH